MRLIPEIYARTNDEHNMLHQRNFWAIVGVQQEIGAMRQTAADVTTRHRPSTPAMVWVDAMEERR